MKKVLIRGGNAVFTEQTRICDILVEGDRIAKIAEHIEDKKAEIIDAAGLYVFPALIDMHVHLREPGFERPQFVRQWDGWQRGGGQGRFFASLLYAEHFSRLR